MNLESSPEYAANSLSPGSKGICFKLNWFILVSYNSTATRIHLFPPHSRIRNADTCKGALSKRYLCKIKQREIKPAACSRWCFPVGPSHRTFGLHPSFPQQVPAAPVCPSQIKPRINPPSFAVREVPLLPVLRPLEPDFVSDYVSG